MGKRTMMRMIGIVAILIIVGYFVLKQQQQPLEVHASSTNLLRMDFIADWGHMQAVTGLDDGAKLENFTLGYDSDGEIRDCTYYLYGFDKSGAISGASVEFIPNKQQFMVRSLKIDQKPLQYDRLVSAKRFFEVLSLMDLTSIKPKGNYEWYEIDSNVELGSYSVPIQPSRISFLIQQDGHTQAIDQTAFPFKGYWILSQGMARVNETISHGIKTVHYEGQGSTYYYFDIAQN